MLGLIVGIVIGFFIGAAVVFSIMAAVLLMQCDQKGDWWEDDV